MTSNKPICETESDGTREWRLHGMLHRIDGPAVEDVNGYKEWCFNGNTHRSDGPAIEYADGTKEWWVNGDRHRTDGPAFEDADGTEEWWVNGQEICEPYTYVLNASFARGIPIPEEAMLEMVKAPEAQTAGEHIGRLKTIIHKHWPMHVQKILATLLMDTDPAIKNIAFSLLGRQVQPDSASTVIAL